MIVKGPSQLSAALGSRRQPCMMRPRMANKVPEKYRLRPRELFFVLLGVATGAGLGVFWFRLAPEAMDAKGVGMDALTGVAALLMHPGFQVPFLLVVAAVLSAGIATRVSSGKDKATWILAAGSVLVFGVLLLSVNVLYEPVVAAEAPGDEAVDDDWED